MNDMPSMTTIDGTNHLIETMTAQISMLNATLAKMDPIRAQRDRLVQALAIIQGSHKPMPLRASTGRTGVGGGVREGSCADAICTALSRTPSLRMVDIRARTGRRPDLISVSLVTLFRKGIITRTGDAGSYAYSLAAA